MIYTFYMLSIGNLKYVGSTKNFANRQSDHKYNCCNPNAPKYLYNCYIVFREYLQTNKLTWEHIEKHIITEIDINTENKTKEEIKKEVFKLENTFCRIMGDNMNASLPLGNNVNFVEE